MKVSQAMSDDVETVRPETTLKDAAKKMADLDLGFLPVADDERLVGMITDRDIAVRAVAQGKDPAKTKVKDVVTGRVLYCFDDSDVEEALNDLARLQIRRMPIVDRDKRLVGVLSLADIAIKHDSERAGMALEAVVQPNGASAIAH